MKTFASLIIIAIAYGLVPAADGHAFVDRSGVYRGGGMARSSSCLGLGRSGGVCRGGSCTASRAVIINRWVNSYAVTQRLQTESNPNQAVEVDADPEEAVAIDTEPATTTFTEVDTEDQNNDAVEQLAQKGVF